MVQLVAQHGEHERRVHVILEQRRVHVDIKTVDARKHMLPHLGELDAVHVAPVCDGNGVVGQIDADIRVEPVAHAFRSLAHELVQACHVNGRVRACCDCGGHGMLLFFPGEPHPVLCG